ncbi:MAG: hypothetical protein IPN59_12835 [Holophaga sp.]|nr:hypothetical protein [Holophaga sp.]
MRARAFRIFPRFTSDGKTISGPQEFAGPLKVRQFSPGYIQLNCQIFPNIELTYDLWVCSSQSLCGALHFLNTAKNTLALQVEISGMLSPLLSSQTSGDRLSVQLAGNRPVLTGTTGNLTPVIQMRSGMSGPAGPNPFIYQVLELPPIRFKPRSGFKLAESASKNLLKSHELPSTGPGKLNSAGSKWRAKDSLRSDRQPALG